MKDRRENGFPGRESGKRKRGALMKREKAAVQQCGAACGRAETLRKKGKGRRAAWDRRKNVVISKARRGRRKDERVRSDARLRQVAEH